MTHASHHRGPQPDDARLFGPAAIPRLQRAAEEVCWLLGRDYSMDLAVRAAGDRHQLEARQRTALRRACCADAVRDARFARARAADSLAGSTLRIDGFNLVITLEVALGGGVLLLGRDGCLRDLAGLRGSYHPVAQTDAVLELVGDTLRSLGVARCEVILDAPVSNSGRLRTRILSHARAWSAATQVELVTDADRALVREGDDRVVVVSADAVVLDHARAWANLGAWIADAAAPDAWRVPLDVRA